MALNLHVDDSANNIRLTPQDDQLRAVLGSEVITEFTKDYNLLDNKPQINSVELIGNKSFEDLGLVIDQELNLESTNPIANKAVTEQGAHIAQAIENLALDVGENARDIGTINNILQHIKQISIDGLGYDILSIFTEKQDDIITDVVFQLDDGSIDGYWLKVPSLDLITAVIGDIDLQLQDLGINKANVSDLPTKTSELQNDGADGTSAYVEADELATVATSGAYADLSGTPTKLSDFNNDTGFITSASLPTKTSDLVNDGADNTSVYVEADELASVATSGAFNDLSGKPSYTATGLSASKTITTLSQSDGTIAATASDIQIRPVQVKVGSSGDEAQVETNDVLPIFDANDSEKLKYSYISFDTNNTSDFLRKDGAFATPSYPVGIPSGGNAGQILKKTSATDYDVNWADQTQYYPSGYSTTGADKQTKQIACSSWTATANTYLHILLTHANTYAGKLYFSVNAVNTYEVWINGAVSSATNYSLPAGTYIIFFDGSAFQVRTDGIIPASISGTACKIPYGECDSTSTSTAFTATVSGITELKDGTTMLLYNGVVTSASGFTIDVNGLGAKPSYSNMTLGNPVTPTNPTRDTTIFNINYAFLFVYSETRVSGGCWIGYRGYDANTNTIGYQLRTNSSTMKTADKFYRYRLLFTSADGTKWVPANTSTSTNATSSRTPNTRAIDPFGEIVWYGTTTAIEANATVTAAQLWQEYAGSYSAIGYSFNNTGAAQTMTTNAPIYIVCTPQADGSAVIDPTTPYVQALPTTEDGKIYIYLGRAYSATNFEITMNHPVYYYHNGGIRIWTGEQIIPSAPSADGVYKLTCTVNNGTVTYSWAT